MRMKPQSVERCCRGEATRVVPEHDCETTGAWTRIELALEIVDETLVAIYDRGLPPSENDRWHLFGMRDALQLALTYIDIA